MPKQSPSGRAYEHVTFEAGMVTIPLSVYNGIASDHGIKRKEFVSVPVLNEDGTQKMVEVEQEDGTKAEVPVFEDHSVGRLALDKTTGKAVPVGQQVVRKIDTEYGFVYVEDHEIEQLFGIPQRTITVKEIQPLHLFHQGHYVPKSLYFVEVTPNKIGKRKVPNEGAERNFAVILAALKAKNAMAVVEFTTRGVPTPGVLLPDGSLWRVYHTDELREQRPLPDVEVPLEVANAAFDKYLADLWGDTPLDLEDARTALIQDFADKKAKAGDFGKAEEPEQSVAVETGGGMDLLSALSASVEQAKAERVS